MTRLARIAGAATAALALFAAPAAMAKDKKSGEEELAELLEGRVAGEPQRCISTFPSANLRVIDGTALVYGRGSTIYVNRTRHPEDLDDDDVLVIRRYGTQLCRLDHVTTVDRFTQFFSGAVFLEEFVPYTRVKDADNAEG